MTVPELYEAYAEGKITRGAFIRRLTGFGMSLAVAAAYADSLVRPSNARAADAQSAAGVYDYYDHPDLYSHPDYYDHPDYYSHP
jgi:hypothetical protein